MASWKAPSQEDQRDYYESVVAAASDWGRLTPHLYTNGQLLESAQWVIMG